MLKTSDAVKDIVYSSETALSALREGYLNLSQYAKTIYEEVEARAKKEVRIGSIVVALSRLRQDIKNLPPLLPQIIVEDLSVKSGLVEIAFDKTRENLERLKRLYKEKDFSSTEFFTLTQGLGEITIISDTPTKEHILRIYKGQKPKAVIDNLVAITARINEKYIEIPNTFYAFLKHFALKRLNIIEMISTYTELTFILRQQDLQEAFTTLNEVFQKQSLVRD